MNQIFKKIVLACFVASLSVLHTAHTQAVDGSNINQKLETKKIEVRYELCEKFGSARFTSGISSKADTALLAIGSRVESLENKRTEWDTKRNEIRSAADSKRKEHYDSLKAKATSDEQKLAVDEFVTSIDAAVATRRLEQDTARDVYRKAVDSLIATQQLELKTAIDTLKADSTAALAKARSSCENGVAVDSVTEVLRDDLSKARADYKTTISERDKLNEQIKPLIDTRKQSVEKAKTAFDAAMSSAKDALKAALNGTN